MSDNTSERPRLGRGLAALLGAAKNGDASADLDTPRRVGTELLRPNPRNPRRLFDETALSDLAASIKERGVIQPIIVRTAADPPDTYEIIAGERRWRAAQLAGQHDVPIIILHVDDREALELAIVENIQRTDLNALEEAAGFAQLGTDYGYSHNDIARVVGKSRSHVANTLRLLSLPEHVRELLSVGKISAGHARALLTIDDPLAVAKRIVDDSLSVRDVERLSQLSARPTSPSRRRDRHAADPDTLALQERLELRLGTKVRIRTVGGAGELCIAFNDADQLNNLCEKLT